MKFALGENSLYDCLSSYQNWIWTILVIVTQCALCNRAIVKITVDFPQFDGRNSCTMCIFDMICLFYAILKLAARLLNLRKSYCSFTIFAQYHLAEVKTAIFAQYHSAEVKQRVCYFVFAYSCVAKWREIPVWLMQFPVTFSRHFCATSVSKRKTTRTPMWLLRFIVAQNRPAFRVLFM